MILRKDTKNSRLWLRHNIVTGIVTKCKGALHKKDNGSGIQADEEDDF